MTIGEEQVSRLMKAAGTNKIKELSAILSVGPSNVSMWKKRGVPEGELYKASHLFNCDFDWLLTGNGEMRRQPNGSAEEASAYHPNGIVTDGLDEEMLLTWYRECAKDRQAQRDILNNAKTTALYVQSRKS